MAKKVAVLAVNPVNGFGLFQYLESFFENGITYKVYAVADSKEMNTTQWYSLVAMRFLFSSRTLANNTISI